MRVLFALCLALTLLSVPGARAQDREFFVQIEAHPATDVAERRARAYSDLLPDVNGFRLGGGWHALTLGPYPESEARAILRRLLGEGLIPRDSYLSDGGTYGERFWPQGPVAPRLPVPPVAVAPSEIPEETIGEARRSESLLSGEERRDLQRALAWFDYYSAGIDGSFGRGTRGSMLAWQRDAGVEPTGVLTTRQRARLLAEWRASQTALGLGPIESAEAGIALTGPMGLVSFDRVEAPFVHYVPKDDSGVRLSLISQPGDRATLAGLYEILQTLDVVPPEGERTKLRDGFSIRGEAPGRTTQVSARLEDGHIFGYLLSWPPAQDMAARRALAEMESTLRRIGPPLNPDEGFDPAEQSLDMVSGLEVRRPLRSGSGFFVDGAGRVATAQANVAGCGRLTLDRLHEARVVHSEAGIAVLAPEGALAPLEVARLAPLPGRLRSAVSVGGYPYGGVLGAATLSFGTLEDVRGLDGSDAVLRLSMETRDGDVGGPVLDMSGRVTGLLLPAPVSDATVLPADVSFAAKASELARVLDGAGVTPRIEEAGGILPPEDLTTRATGITVLVNCWE
ncbi:serine protease [Jannaschia seohaensis]|uniref:S1-C subfamily serine protease n=1 Tax=Jannaschia seohaensis TaxID=475081 RepID=A0A2Y9C7U8_9RHOB|nr:serine protease [Jannaschia seohaensis]PWJ18318.1 S1-C subfamily serine protease [Jannaschia seohaensis]SSA46843.1 serine protease, S1-C subfamily, contains C-terminal PDZ domain [Jannaschia seohaensis]